jgi:8-oxo-dGTP pyrophosphatase MutT (NUDIX family)/L-amino acid N-acyltransferase YncA
LKPKVLIYVTRMREAKIELLAFRHRDFPNAGLQVPAGTVEDGEDLIRAAKREVFEESGLVLDDDITFRGAFEYVRPDNGFSHLRYVFHHHVKGETKNEWKHVVSVGGDDANLVFTYSWYPLSYCMLGLTSEQGRYLPSLFQQVNDNIQVRVAVPGEESAIHEAHLRSVREICVKDHGEEEIRGWGFRPLENRWITQIRTGYTWVVESFGVVQGVGHIRMFEQDGMKQCYLHALYLTPDVKGKGAGKKLVNLMIKTAIDLQAVSITLDSTITAKGFYERLGFVSAGDMKKVDIGGYSVTSFPMKMDLEPIANRR